MSVHIEGLLDTGERIAAPKSTAAWFPIANQDAFVHDANADPEAFWHQCARGIDWEVEPRSTFHGSIGDQHWFTDGRLNATVSCLDRHAHLHPSSIAYDFICEDGTERSITYADLLAQTNQFANALKADGVALGYRVCIYMP